MKNFFSKYKIIFYLINIFLIFLYSFPGSFVGLIIYGNKRIQPQITSDFFISSNHFYAFLLISIIGFFSYIELKRLTYLKSYLILLAIILELLHIIIPERSFQWSDLFGNLFGVLVVIFLNTLINKYGAFKK